MDVDVDINQNHDNFFKKALVHPNNASSPHRTSSPRTRSESPTVSKKIQLLYDEGHDDGHDDTVFEDHTDENDDYKVHDDDDDDESSSVKSKEGFVKRRIERWERRLSQGDETDVRGAVNQGQASLELRQRDLPAPVVIPPTFLHGSVSLCENSQAEQEISVIRFNVIRMKADFQMNELKLKYAKWQYDVNKGVKRPVRSPNRNPALSWSSENVSLPDIPENMAVRRRGEGSPNIAHQISLASFGNDGRRQDTSGHQHGVNQRVLLSHGGQNPRSMTSQPHVVTPLSSSYGSQGQVLRPAKTNHPTSVAQSLPANNYGLESMELKLRNVNKQIEKERSASPRTLVEPLKPFADNLQQPQIMRGSGGIESHGSQMDHQQRFKRSGNSNIQTSHGYQMDHQQRFERSGTSNIQTPHGYKCWSERSGTAHLQTSHSVPSTGTTLQVSKAPPLNLYADNRQQLQRMQGSSGIKSHDFQKDHRRSCDTSRTANIQTSHTVPITMTSPHVSKAAPLNPYVDNRQQSQIKYGYVGIESHSYQRDHQHGMDRSGTSNIQTPHGYQIDHQRRSERPGTLNIQTSHGTPSTRTVRQDDITRTNKDLVNLKIERDRLLNDFSDILVEQGIAQQEKMEDEMSSGGISDGSGYDYEDSWEMETAESPIESYDVATQFPYPGEGESSQETLQFETIESMQDESQCLIEGSIETFQSSEFTCDVCIQVSVRTMPEIITNRLPDAIHSHDNVSNNNDLSADRIDTPVDIQSDNSELQEKTPGKTPLDETGKTMNGKHSGAEAVEHLVMPVNHPNDNSKFSAVDGHRGNQLKNLAQEMDNCSRPVYVEQEEQAPEAFFHVDETSGNSKSDQSKVIVEEFVPRLNCLHDNSQFGAVGAHHDDVLENLAREMYCNAPVSLKEREQTPETFSQADESSMNNQSDSSKVVVEEFVPRLKGSPESLQFAAIGAHHDDVLEKLAHEMDNYDTTVCVDKREQTPENHSQVDETTATRSKRSEEFVPCLKGSSESLQFSATDAHHGGKLEKLTQEMFCNTTVSVEKREQKLEMFSPVDEAAVNNQTDISKVVFEDYAPHLKCSRDNSQVDAIGADLDDVLKQLAHEMDNCNIPVRTEGNELLVDIDLHISADDVKSDHAEPQEQPLEMTSHQDQRPINSQSDTKKEVVEEFVPRLDLSAHAQCNTVSANSEDDLERLTQELNECNNIVTVDRDGLHSTVDLHAESRPSTSQGQILEEVKCDQTDLPKETRLDQRSEHVLDNTSKQVVEEMIPSLKLPHNKEHLNTSDAQVDNALHKLAEEMDRSNNSAVSPEQERICTASDRSNVRDDKRPVTDNFYEVLAEGHRPSVNLLKLSSFVDEGNASSFQTETSAGSPNVNTALTSSSEAELSDGCHHRSQIRVGNEDEIKESDRRISVNSGDFVLPNSYNTAEQSPNHALEFDVLPLPTHVEDNKDLSKDEYFLAQGTSKISATPKDVEDKLDNVQQNTEELNISRDVTTEFPTALKNELVIDELSKDGTSLDENGDTTNQKSPKDIIFKDNEVPRRSKIPVLKSKLTRSKSFSVRSRSNGKVHNQNSQTPKDHERTKEAPLNNASVKTLPIDIKATSPVFSNYFSFRNERSRSSFKGDKELNSHIPIPTAKFKRRKSCPTRSRPAIIGNSSGMASSDNLKANVTPHASDSRGNTKKKRSRDIDITEALAVSDKEDAINTAFVTSDEQSPREIESKLPDVSDSLIIHDEKQIPVAEDVIKSLSLMPSETDDFIQRARQILSRIPIPQTNAPQALSVPFHLDPSIGEDNQELNGVSGPALPEALPEKNNRALSLPERDMEFLSLEAEAGEDDTASETLTLHSENDFDIQSPLHDEVLSIMSSENDFDRQSPLHDEVLSIMSSETAEDVSEADSQKSSKSRIPVLKGSRKPIHKGAPMVDRGDSEDGVVSDLSGRERSVARISPMPREVEDESTPTPSLRKSFKSRIPLPSHRAIMETSTTKRTRSYSETDGENAMYPDMVSEKVRQEESEDIDDEIVGDHHSEPEQEHFPRRTNSTREVRPRGSYWAFSTSPNLAFSEFERSQTLRVNRSKNSGRKSPGGTTPRGTTPRSTPRTTPRGTPRTTPRGTPRDTPRGGSLRRQHPQSKTLPTFKSRECAFVPLPEWNRLREVLSSGEQSKKSSTCPSPSEYSYTSRRSSVESERVHSPRWETPVTTPKPSRWRVDGRVPQHLKKKYSSMSDMGDNKDLYQSDQDMSELGATKQETDSPWVMQPPIRASSSSQSVSHTDRHYGVKDRKANTLGERSSGNAKGRSPTASVATTDVQPMSSAEDVSTIWTEGDTLESSNFSLPTGAKKKSWKRRFSLRRKKSADPSKVEDKESDEVKREKKKRKNWLLRFLGLKK